MRREATICRNAAGLRTKATALAVLRGERRIAEGGGGCDESLRARLMKYHRRPAYFVPPACDFVGQWTRQIGSEDTAGPNQSERLSPKVERSFASRTHNSCEGHRCRVHQRIYLASSQRSRTSLTPFVASLSAGFGDL